MMGMDESTAAPAPQPQYIDGHGIFFRDKGEARGAWLTPDGHTTRLKIYAAWARTEPELEKFKEVAAEISAGYPDALVEVRKL